MYIQAHVLICLAFPSFRLFCWVYPSLLPQEALSWGGALDEELRRAATTLALSQIVQRYHVVNFNLVDAPRATRLLRYLT